MLRSQCCVLWLFIYFCLYFNHELSYYWVQTVFVCRQSCWICVRLCLHWVGGGKQLRHLSPTVKHLPTSPLITTQPHSNILYGPFHHGVVVDSDQGGPLWEMTLAYRRWLPFLVKRTWLNTVVTRLHAWLKREEMLIYNTGIILLKFFFFSSNE